MTSAGLFPQAASLGALATLGYVGTVVEFHVGLTDALVLEEEFRLEITADDLVSLPNFNIYLRLMIDDVVSKPFGAVTLPAE